MNFTREPIVETVITPKDGYKLMVRNCKVASGEECLVDALEVISFGHSFFYRSTEKPKSFLFPVGDYEVIEVKESRTPLKNAPFERTIKIGGGKNFPPRQDGETPSETPAEGGGTPAPHGDRRRDRRRNRRRGHQHDRQPFEQAPVNPESSETPPAPISPAPTFSGLISPPATLISDTISRYREKKSDEEELNPQNDTGYTTPEPTLDE